MTNRVQLISIDKMMKSYNTCEACYYILMYIVYSNMRNMYYSFTKNDTYDSRK